MKKTIITTLLILLGFNNNLLSQDKNIIIDYKINSDNSIDFRYKKKIPGSFFINLKFNSLQNASRNSFKGVIKNKSGNLFKLKPINTKKGIRFSYKFSYTKGTPNPKVDYSFIYSLPFKKNKTINVIESANLNKTYFGSEKPSKWKSYIINKSSADTICSIRKGIVIEIVNKFKRDTLVQYDYTSNMNRVVIEHPDGTFASYSGFNKDSIFVKLGQTVYPQTQLGILDLLNNSTYRLYFNIFYLIDSNSKIKNEYLTPYFNTNEGVVKLKDRHDYTVIFNETMLFQELTKREKKKYKKNPELFE